jgi:hypothetical protein
MACSLGQRTTLCDAASGVSHGADAPIFAGGGRAVEGGVDTANRRQMNRDNAFVRV